MRELMIFVAAAVGMVSASAFAQPDEDMELQRCIWGCLAQSSGNDDPAYHECVERMCLAEERAVSAPPASLSPPATVQDTARLNPAQVVSVQQALAALGFDPGPTDGVYGRRTEAAVQAFRASQGLNPAGGIDDAFLNALQAAY